MSEEKPAVTHVSEPVDLVDRAANDLGMLLGAALEKFNDGLTGSRQLKREDFQEDFRNVVTVVAELT